MSSIITALAMVVPLVGPTSGGGGGSSYADAVNSFNRNDRSALTTVGANSGLDAGAWVAASGTTFAALGGGNGGAGGGRSQGGSAPDVGGVSGPMCR